LKASKTRYIVLACALAALLAAAILFLMLSNGDNEQQRTGMLANYGEITSHRVYPYYDDAVYCADAFAVRVTDSDKSHYVKYDPENGVTDEPVDYIPSGMEFTVTIDEDARVRSNISGEVLCALDGASTPTSTFTYTYTVVDERDGAAVIRGGDEAYYCVSLTGKSREFITIGEEYGFLYTLGGEMYFGHITQEGGYDGLFRVESGELRLVFSGSRFISFVLGDGIAALFPEAGKAVIVEDYTIRLIDLGADESNKKYLPFAFFEEKLYYAVNTAQGGMLWCFDADSGEALLLAKTEYTVSSVAVHNGAAVYTTCCVEVTDAHYTAWESAVGYCSR